MKKYFLFIFIGIFLFNCTYAEPIYAKEYASFSSFYKESTSWGKWAIAGTLAVGTGLAVFFTGGAASPLVAPFVTTIGGWFGAAGLYGAAATSSGLAFLGGGTIASGGLGMAGGAALLSTVLTGAAEVGGIGVKAYLQKRAYDNLNEELKNAPNFPPFINDSGPACIEEAKESLDKDYDSNQPPSSGKNARAIRSALYELNRYHQPTKHIWNIGYEETVCHEKLRVEALKSLLYFMIDDYKSAYKAANAAYTYYKYDDGNQDLILFIRGVAGLLTQNVDLNTSMVYVDRAISSNRENPFIPLMFSIYMSRVDALDMMSTKFIKNFSTNLNTLPSEINKTCYVIMAMAIIKQLNSYANDILIFKENSHVITKETIDESLQFCNDSYSSYKDLLKFANSFRNRMPLIDTENSSRSFNVSFRNSLEELTNKNKELESAIASLKNMVFENLDDIPKHPIINDTPNISVTDNENTSLPYTYDSAQEDFYAGLRAYNSGDSDRAKTLLQRSCESKLYDRSCTYMKKYFADNKLSEDNKNNSSSYTYESAQDDFYDGIREYNSGNIDKAKFLLGRSCESKLYNRACTYMKKYFTDNLISKKDDSIPVKIYTNNDNSAKQYFYEGIREFNLGNKDNSLDLLNKACKKMDFNPACIYIKNNF